MEGAKVGRDYENGRICEVLDCVGACPRCIFRFLGVRTMELYRSNAEVLRGKKDDMIASLDAFGGVETTKDGGGERANGNCSRNLLGPHYRVQEDESTITGLKELKKVLPIAGGSKDYDLINFEETGEGVLEYGLSVAPCVCCFGILQFVDNEVFIAHCREKIRNCRYEFETYLLTLTIPGSVLLRHRVVWYLLCELFPGFECLKLDFKGDGVPEVKEVFKWVMGGLISEWTDIKYESDSRFEIRFLFAHRGTDDECSILTQIPRENKSFIRDIRCKTNENKKKKVVLTTGSEDRGVLNRKKKISISSTISLLNDVNGSILLDQFGRNARTCRNVQLDNRAKMAFLAMKEGVHGACTTRITFYRRSLYVAGRYCKYSRSLSQSPWIIDGIRKGKYSIQETICSVLKERYGSEDYKFMSAGREDMDVRMLGSGRPFAVELINPRRLHFDGGEFERIQEEINACNPDDLSVFDLQSVEEKDLALLKEGEENRRKSYQCLVWTPEPPNPQKIASLSERKQLPIQQDTPIRVLHRRSLKTRSKVIYDISIKCLDNHYMIVNLTTQAGTYIKEFIHSDFGRTRPSFCELIGQQDADILLLDVIEVELDFPKQLENTRVQISNKMTKIPPICQDLDSIHPSIVASDHHNSPSHPCADSKNSYSI